MRSKSLRVGWTNSAGGLDLTREKKWQKELSDYKAARADGIQPDGTTAAKIRDAVERSDEAGVAYGTPAYDHAGVRALQEAVG